LNPELPGSDELSHLDLTFHQMAQALANARHKERAVFDHCQDVICTISPGGLISSVSPACERLWGYAPSDLTGKSLSYLTAGEDGPATIDAIARAVRSQEPLTFEGRLTHKDGSPRHILWSFSWSPAEEMAIAIAHDISKRKELERLKQEFLSMVSHDMRTPLTGIAGTAELLVMGACGPLPEKAAHQLAVVQRNCQRLVSLINDLLDMDKLESGRMQLTIQPVAVRSLLEQVVQTLDASAGEKHLQLVVESGDDLTMHGDPDRLTQVGVNLLSNAIKFSPEGGTVVISARSKAGAVEIRITDQGRGVPQEYQDGIFERYKQVTAGDGRRRAGTGLGLPICKSIVEQHGGTIGVESEPGKGSTFWFSIPAAQRELLPKASDLPGSSV
jgi:PAS domain S-box-containing protein